MERHAIPLVAVSPARRNERLKLRSKLHAGSPEAVTKVCNIAHIWTRITASILTPEKSMSRNVRWILDTESLVERASGEIDSAEADGVCDQPLLSNENQKIADETRKNQLESRYQTVFLHKMRSDFRP
jgi:hypothetical protein